MDVYVDGAVAWRMTCALAHGDRSGYHSHFQPSNANDDHFALSVASEIVHG